MDAIAWIAIAVAVLKMKKSLDPQGFKTSFYYDLCWVRTSDPYPVKIVLSR